MIILGTNSVKDTGFDATNSLRFNLGSEDYIDRTAGSAGNQKKFTFSTWIKRSKIAGGGGPEQFIFYGRPGSDTDTRLYFTGDGNSDDDALFFQSTTSNSSHTSLKTTAKFRDATNWFHIVISVNTQDGNGSSSTIQMYIDGTKITDFATENYGSQNSLFYWTDDCLTTLGRRSENNGQHFSGYLAETVLIDGQALDHTSFGQLNDDDVWVPKDVSGLTFGTTGFYLDYEDSSALGNDAAGSNNFAVHNLTAIDQNTDVPTNNFATLNPLNTDGGTFTEGNLQHTRSSAGYRHAISTIGVSSGKWYVEIKSPDVENIGVGVINGATSSNLNMSGGEQFLGQHSYDAGYFFNGILYVGNSSQSGTWTAYSSNDIIGIALDADNGYVYFSKNGTFVNSGNPASGSSGTGGYALSGIGGSGTYFIGVSTGNNSEHYVNFGNPIFSISSGNQDADGFGNMEYAFPSGYFCINQKNIAEYG